MRFVISALVVFVWLEASWGLGAQSVPLPNLPESLKVAVIGDNGTGDTAQYDVGRQMSASRAGFPFELVLMMGDNFYGSQGPDDLVRKFDRPYAALLRAGVTFHAVLGNHDEPETRFYPPLNMGGERHYTFSRKGVRFIALDTNFLDERQLAWFEATLRESREPWKICYFHHPLYSNARRHGSAPEIRVLLEPLLVQYGVDVVFSGHDHIYERLKPQRGVHYFVSGSGGQLRRGDLRPSEATAAGFDQDRTFMLVEFAGDILHFQTISREGRIVDAGVIRRRGAPVETTAAQ